MAFTYDPTAMTPRDRVRLMLGDTDSGDPMLQDAEVDAFISTSAGGLVAAAAAAASAIASKFGRLSSVSTGGLTVKFTDQASHFTALAAMLQGRADAASSNSVAAPGVYGVSRSAMADVDADPDRPDFGDSIGMRNQDRGEGWF